MLVSTMPSRDFAGDAALSGTTNALVPATWSRTRMLAAVPSILNANVRLDGEMSTDDCELGLLVNSETTVNYDFSFTSRLENG